MKINKVLVIDLFAGPGGLAEGFTSYSTKKGKKIFEIGVSVEKEASAHKTLTTRSLFRKLSNNPKSLKDYYNYVQGKLTREELFSKYPNEAEQALNETLNEPRTLGEDNDIIHTKIKELINKHHGFKVVIGGPPCQAYSLAGRSRNAGNKNYAPEEDKRHFLYKEYLKVLTIAKPEVFIMENVRGILSSKINNTLIFPQILEDLQSPNIALGTDDTLGYRIYSLTSEICTLKILTPKELSKFLIRSEQYGIPQARHRVILIGIRNDINLTPGVLKPSLTFTSVKDAIDDLPRLRSGFSKQTDSEKTWSQIVSNHTKKLKELLKDHYPEEQLAKLDIEPSKGLPRKSNTYSGIYPCIPEPLKSWILDKNLNYVLNHETRGHLSSDLLRYAFCATFALLNNGSSPKSGDFPDELAPAHLNWKTGKHADRFRVQSANKVATTVTSHISKDGHYFIHYDPKQCRSLTVREVARLQTFPDNYFFEGNRTEQYVQVGNAVPPFLARQIAHIVSELLQNIDT